MRQYIAWTLDESEPIEPENPLGNISITGSSGSFEERETFIDSFFEALAHGIQVLESRSEITVDLQDEPYTLVLARSGDGLRLRYRDKVVWFEDREVFAGQLRTAITKFLSRLDSSRAKPKGPATSLPALRRFVS